MSGRAQLQDHDDDGGAVGTHARGATGDASVAAALAAPSPFLAWPFAAAASAGQAAAAMLEVASAAWTGGARPGRASPAPAWATPNAVRLELPTMRLRDFSSDRAAPATIVCAPFALHRSTTADFAPGHSLVETLRGAGVPHVLVTDWRSATPDMRGFSIDTYLADLNVAVDECAAPVDLVGLCQGGWLALVYAARFPGKVRRLVLAGAPVDVAAAPSGLARLAAAMPDAAFDNLVGAGGGCAPGRRLLQAWGAPPTDAEIDAMLQVAGATDPRRRRDLRRRFRSWDVATVDLPGTYYLQVVRRLFKENQIAGNRFVALGRRVDLRSVTVPTCLLAGRDDELVPPAQLLAVARLIGTPPADIVARVEPCGHLDLFMGGRTLATAWREIGGWLAERAAPRVLAA
jgi:poly(3-hydroxyalkanoate) synthetase